MRRNDISNWLVVTLFYLGVVSALLLAALGLVWLGTAAGLAANASPLTASQVITLEHGPDGTWLSQAWIIELQARPDTRLAVVYDTWRHSQGDSDMDLAYRQWDVSATYQRMAMIPWSITTGLRWRTGVTEHSLGGSGPWVYGTLVVGW